MKCIKQTCHTCAWARKTKRRDRKGVWSCANPARRPPEPSALESHARTGWRSFHCREYLSEDRLEGVVTT